MSYEEKITLKKRIKKFLEKYHHLYDEFEINNIFSTLKYIDIKDLYYVEVIREILDELGVIPKEYNIYDAYISFLSTQTDLKNKNIIEIGGGRFPCLGRRINDVNEKGKITIYDPKLFKQNTNGNFILKKEKASLKTNVEEYDVIIGLMPCEGAETIIDLAINNNKDFFLWLCEGGPHGDEYDFYEDEDEWRTSMIDKAASGVAKNNMGNLKIKKLNQFSNKYPIIYNVR